MKTEDMLHTLKRWPVGLCSALTLAFAAHGVAAPMDQPAPADIAQARALVSQMRANPRGPYARLRWFCNDGTVHPPTSYACRERGGGRQHGEYSTQWTELAGLGFHTGTVFAALTFEELFDADRRHDRLRELPLERYMQQIDDGWVLRLAQDYRGRVQVEAETRTGRELILRLLEDRSWVAANYLLTREAIRTIPHGNDSDLMRTVRRTAQELAERDNSAERLRIEVHTVPTANTAVRYRAWASTRAPELAQIANDLASQLDLLFGADGRRARIAERVAALRRSAPASPLHAILDDILEQTPELRLARLAEAMLLTRAHIEVEAQRASTRLALFDLLAEIEAELMVTATERQNVHKTRAAHIDATHAFIDAAYSVGLLSAGERGALTAAATKLGADPRIEHYQHFVQQLVRAPQWAAGAIRYTFLEPLTRYVALDPRAARFSDDLLRNSPLLWLGQLTQVLNRDMQTLTGVGTSLFGTDVTGVVGLNAGHATGRLVIYPTLESLSLAAPERGDIVVLPETTAELVPVAGILTLGEGNPLSHVQLLARNFAIPNVALAPTMLPLLERHAGRTVTLAVNAAGSVVLLTEDAALTSAADLLAVASEPEVARLTVPVPDLDRLRPLEIDELHKGLSGRVVGPKAANLGELNRLFPGRVAPAIALPFGSFAAHTLAPRRRLAEAYASFRTGALTSAELDAALAEIRGDIATTRVGEETAETLRRMMAELFGPPGSYGVFIRSDTNVEDLPQFTGAGLSETVPNVVGPDAQLAAIPRVWASVLSPRAIAWRSNLLTNPEHVYASVLLMKSVPSTKSGVLITANIVEPGAPGLTVATAWGVGGAVAGEAAETLVLREDDSELLVSEAKAAYRRQIEPGGGVTWQPASDGPVLTAAERTAVRQLAREALAKYPPVVSQDNEPRPWDIEFGFVNGELTLFQIRPLVERNAQRAERLVARLLGSDQAFVREDHIDLFAPPTTGVR